MNSVDNSLQERVSMLYQQKPQYVARDADLSSHLVWEQMPAQEVRREKHSNEIYSFIRFS